MNLRESRARSVRRPIYLASVAMLLTVGLAAGAIPANAQSNDQGKTLLIKTAAQSNPHNKIQLSKIVVVGSRIPRTSIASSRPVVFINRQQILASGLINVGQLLQRLTSSGSALNSRIDVGGNGTTELNLHNLGAKRLLILVNGKRWVTGLDGAVDLDTIPTSIIQRIEVLEDGASAIYGSDAIAGVVNIITMKNYNGAQVGAYYGLYDGHGAGGGWDGPTEQYYATMGAGNDKGNVTFSVEYRHNNGINDTARTYSSVPYYGTPLGSSMTPQGRFEFYPPAGSSLYNNSYLCPKNSAGQPFCNITIKTGTNGQSISDYRPFIASDHFNYAKLYDLIAPNTNATGYVQGHYALSNNINFHTTFMYDRHRSIQSYSPIPLDITAGGLDFVISKNNPYNPFGFDLNPNISSPQSGVAQLIFLGRRPIEAGYRNFEENTGTLYYNGGLNGQWNYGERFFSWNADYTYGHVQESDLTPTGEFNTGRMQLALGPASACDQTAGCVPLNLFGGQYQGGTITPQMLKYIQTSEQSQTTETLKDFEVNIASADIADLPGGPLGFAAGSEYRQLTGAYHPDTLRQAKMSTDGYAAFTGGSYHVTSVYGEIYVPLLADMPAFKTLSLDLATRWSRYSSFGTNTTSQVGLKWQPIKQLLIRASWSQGFRAPNIAELYTGPTTGFPFVMDPCDATNLQSETSQTAASCAVAGVPLTYHQGFGETEDTFGGNSHLKPEMSLSRTIGFVFSPSAVPGLDINADYYTVAVNNLISTYGAQNILNACYIGGSSQFCDLVQRNSAGIITHLQDIYTNVGSIVTKGIDVGGKYQFITNIGSFTVSLQSTFLREYEETIPSASGGAPTVYRLAGWERGDVYTGYPRNKTNLSADWNYGHWQALWRIRYISPMIEDCTGFGSFGVCSDPQLNTMSYTGQAMIATNHLGGTFYQDAQVGYYFYQYNTTVIMGVNNMWNKEPPLSYSAHNLTFDPTVYDIPGRFFYIRLTYSF